MPEIEKEKEPVIPQKIVVFMVGIITLFVWIAPTSAWGRWGFGLGKAGIRLDSRGGVSVSTPTPQVTGGVGAGAGDVSVTATPKGVTTHASGPYGTSAGVNSDGNFHGGVTPYLPGGASGGVNVDNNGVGADVMVDPSVDVDF